jgi:hypothetical protein
MSQLREEYKKNQQHKEELIDEAAYKWVESNIVLINEQIDRRMIKRLINSITKFDETFGPYKSKIPALASQLDTAEADLQKVLTGRANDQKASDMLKRLSFLYNAFSRFFGRDLPILLSSHLFSAPRANPAVRLDVLQPKDGERYDPTAVRDALQHALTPGADDQKLIRKIYRSKNVPLVDAASISNQLLQLSFNELQALGEVGKGAKVPMVATDEVAPVGESVDRNQKKDNS